VAELDRKLAAQRESLHGRKNNALLAQADVVNLEKASYLGWQKRYGKSVGFCDSGEDKCLRVESSCIQPVMGSVQPGPNLARGLSRPPAQSGLGASQA
jgi:hypothetical protein